MEFAARCLNKWLAILEQWGGCLTYTHAVTTSYIGSTACKLCVYMYLVNLPAKKAVNLTCARKFATTFTRKSRECFSDSRCGARLRNAHALKFTDSCVRPEPCFSTMFHVFRARQNMNVFCLQFNENHNMGLEPGYEATMNELEKHFWDSYNWGHRIPETQTGFSSATSFMLAQPCIH